MPDYRVEAQRNAVAFASRNGQSLRVSLTASPEDELLALSDALYRWLSAPVAITVSFADHTYPQGPTPGPGIPTFLEGPNMAQIPDNYQVSLSVAEKDSKQQPVTGDNLAWAVDDTTVATLVPSADGYSALAVAGIPGTTAGTVTDSTVDPPLVGTFQIAVTPGEAQALIVTEGTPEPQP